MLEIGVSARLLFRSLSNERAAQGSDESGLVWDCTPIMALPTGFIFGSAFSPMDAA